MQKKEFQSTRYQLESLLTGRVFEDTGWLLDDPEAGKATLIRARYEKKQISVKDDSYGIYKYADWLPVNKMLAGSSAPRTFQSNGLAKKLGLSNLWITFSGYWPEKDCYMPTCSFKETEAYSVCGRMTEREDKILVVASAGNTSRAFARVCSDNNIPLLLCVPEDNIDSLWFDRPVNDNVKLIVSRSGSDYFDAIHLSNLACRISMFLPEGGARNVARRDGMGTTVLSAADTIGSIPDYYFQAVGSGTGAIAAWEANLRLINDGRFGTHKMKLMVSQNYPFVPIFDAWKAKSRDILAFDDQTARKQAALIDAKVLSNRKPPYSLVGGLYDALLDTEGDVLIASNTDAVAAGKLFSETEGIDLHPASAIATATLLQAVKENRVSKDACIMLNITGGGEYRFKTDHNLFFLKPSLVFEIDPDFNTVAENLARLF